MHVPDFEMFQNQSLHTARPKLAAWCEDGDMGWKRNCVCWTHMVVYMYMRSELMGSWHIGTIYWLKNMAWYEW